MLSLPSQSLQLGGELGLVGGGGGWARGEVGGLLGVVVEGGCGELLLEVA